MLLLPHNLLAKCTVNYSDKLLLSTKAYIVFKYNGLVNKMLIIVIYKFKSICIRSNID